MSQTLRHTIIKKNTHHNTSPDSPRQNAKNQGVERKWRVPSKRKARVGESEMPQTRLGRTLRSAGGKSLPW